jgi:CubicO group peptidase (beta-lactamase class C family)
LIGIAIQEGYINSIDDLVLDFFPERTFANDDVLKRSITLEHLLTMSAALEWDFDEMVSRRDWVQFVFDQPMSIQYLFDPLGISDIRWQTEFQGIPKGGWGLGHKAA